ncbi:hypothetical protein [Halalkalibacter oceani]|uniref:Spore coat protein D n=1 Tax=Halalkalibacter oceani TaxID=1653776 RepID=A0A9X2IQH9_9BACI|nr:hypothetical protein [Halalkalibacter oceani]MCM3716315.1 hypothetical protein [Halalkalibacter oceani]
MGRCPRPIVCPTQYVVNDQFLRREVPVIHPVVFVNRLNIFDVPRHITAPVRKDVVINHGFRPYGPGAFGPYGR